VEATCENCGKPANYHPEMCLCPDCEAKLLRETDHGDECPLCQCGTVEHADGEVKCRGECGATVPLQEG
jgi:hypothetical protein